MRAGPRADTARRRRRRAGRRRARRHARPRARPSTVASVASPASPSRQAEPHGTVIPPKRAAEVSARATAVRRFSAATRRASVPAAAGSATAIPHRITARRPSQPRRAGRPRARSRRAREHRLQREDERRPRRARPLLRPRLHEEGERAREDARDESAPQTVPPRGASTCPAATASSENPERGDHLRERERERVEARREPLHQDDLERVTAAAASTSRSPVASRPPRRRAARVRSRERDAEPQPPARTMRKRASPIRRQDTYIPVTKPAARNGRAVEARRLQGVPAASSARAGTPPRHRCCPSDGVSARPERQASRSRSRSGRRGTRTAGRARVRP